MPTNDWDRLVDVLAEIVASNDDGGGDHAHVCGLLTKAEKLLKRIAPDVLKRHKAAVKEAAGVE